ncbi:solute carrier family 22 member 5, partial [Asbolus verrucosus]
MRYHNSLVPVGETSPPEELPSRIAGGCSRWQICIGVMAFISELIHGLNLYSKMITEPRKLNFTCENGNGICDEEAKRIWIENSFRIGVIISYFIIGWTADRCGRKIAAMTFIPLHCLSGALTLIYSNYGMLLFFHLIHGVFCTSVNLLPKVALCDSVGNKWRTFALGFTVYPLPISWMLVVYFTTLFSDIKEIIGAIAVLPLILLVPLLYFRDSPIYILLKSDFVEAEEVLRKIAQFNNCPLSRDIRIRPVELIEKTLPDQ